MNLTWENPPASKGPGKKTCPEADALRANPNQWAKVYEKDSQSRAGAVATTIKKGTRAGFGPKGTFEATTRTQDGKGVVYARFVGGEA